jgi:DNA-binding transcriptional regulator PaaX
VKSLILLEARPSAGESDEEIVAGAWDFAEINRRYAEHLQVLSDRPRSRLGDPSAAQAFRKWATQERAAWLEAIAADPLLPEVLLPRDYLGRKAWQARTRVLGHAAKQLHHFRDPR